MARSLKNLGIGCLVAQSINGLFFRNCVNFAFPAIECAAAFDAFEEGDIAEVDFDAATVRNVTRGQAFDAIALPPKLLDLLTDLVCTQHRAGDGTQAARTRHGNRQLGATHASHGPQHDRHINVEQRQHAGIRPCAHDLLQQGSWMETW